MAGLNPLKLQKAPFSSSDLNVAGGWEDDRFEFADGVEFNNVSGAAGVSTVDNNTLVFSASTHGIEVAVIF